MHSDEAKQNWSQMSAADPAAGHTAMRLVTRNADGRRDFKQFKQVLNTWSRTKEVALGNRWKELDRAEFYQHWIQRGRNKKSVKKNGCAPHVPRSSNASERCTRARRFLFG